jgi:hypothetical protein
VYARSSQYDPDGPEDWSTHTIKSGNISSFMVTSCSTVGWAQGFPNLPDYHVLVSYFEKYDEELCFAYSDNADPQSLADWTDYVLIADNGFENGKVQSLMLRYSNGSAGMNLYPSLLFSQETASGWQLRYARALWPTPNSAAKWSFHTIAGFETEPIYSLSAQRVAGKPAVAVVRGNDLYYFYANSDNPTAAGDWTELDFNVSGIDSGSTVSLTALDGEVPFIAYSRKDVDGSYHVATVWNSGNLNAGWCRENDATDGRKLAYGGVALTSNGGLPLIGAAHEGGYDTLLVATE